MPPPTALTGPSAFTPASRPITPFNARPRCWAWAAARYGRLPATARAGCGWMPLSRAIASDRQAGVLPIAIVANAGTTNTGAIDPLQAIGDIAKERAIWFHIDGAYGLPGILDERISHLYQGLALADSVIVDPHKWLGASVGVAATLVRHCQLLYRAFTQEAADYLEGAIEQEGHAPTVIEHSMDDFGIP